MNRMNKALLILAVALIGAGVSFFQKQNSFKFQSPSSGSVQTQRPLDKYTIEALTKTKFEASEITLSRVLDERADSTSYVFYFYVQSNSSTHSINSGSSTNSGLKKVNGLINVPQVSGEHPVLVMFRGYVDREVYKTGVGTQRAGEVFAKNGFITVAPDFLGYGESDNPSESPIEERFQTYVAALTLLASIGNLNSTFAANDLPVSVNPGKVFLWGHSNGGQIALTVLEITAKSIPTVLWAPVSKPFPYSILYYTDAFEDRGKMLRLLISEFEKDYDVEQFNLTNFFDRITAPIQIHQGTNDDAVPVKWSDELVSELKKKEKSVDYFTYSGADHNLLPAGWSLAVARAIDFYRY